jgi:Sulfotransferase family
VQRVLGSYDEVATASEPWLLLPLLLPLRDDVPAPGAWQTGIHEALGDFFEQLPDGQASYERSVGEAASRLYGEAAGGAPYFLDKTPPYSLIVDQIVSALPEAKVVILWRNPLAVLASVVETFCDGRWRPQDYPTSLFVGLERLVDAASRHEQRICTVRYESLLEGEDEWERLCRYLELDFNPTSLQRFAGVQLTGAMGDPTGTKAYSRLEKEPTAKWRRTIANPLRRRWAERYLDWIGDERLATMGYDGPSLQRELKRADSAWAGLPRDGLDLLDSVGRDLVKAKMGASTGVWRRLFGS